MTLCVTVIIGRETITKRTTRLVKEPHSRSTCQHGGRRWFCNDGRSTIPIKNKAKIEKSFGQTFGDRTHTALTSFPSLIHPYFAHDYDSRKVTGAPAALEYPIQTHCLLQAVSEQALYKTALVARKGKLDGHPFMLHETGAISKRTRIFLWT
jgi:hypothetical protein